MAKKLRKPGIAGSALALLAILASPAAAAAPQALDCLLTDIEISSAGIKFESRAASEKRSVSVMFDDGAKTLRVKQDGTGTPLDKVAISQTSMTGAAEHISVGIDRSSWRIVFQTYEEGVTRCVL